MSKKYQIIISILVIILAAAWVWQSRTPDGENESSNVMMPRHGFLAPDFTLQTIDGEVITLSDLQGQPVVINLWASWCPPCRAEMPAIENVYQQYQEENLEILAVNLTSQDNLQNAVDFVGELDLSFPILLDLDGEVGRIYQSGALPTTYFVDRYGVIQDVIIGGPMAEALLKIRVEELIRN